LKQYKKLLALEESILIAYQLEIRISAQIFIQAHYVIAPLTYMLYYKEIAQTVIDFIEYRQQKLPREEKEKGYLELEKKHWKAVFASKPWVTVDFSRRRRKYNYVQELLNN
jgi:hypothetical protein